MTTNRTETVRDFATLAFRAAGYELDWRGSGADGVCGCTGRVLMRINLKYDRSAEVDLLNGDPGKALAELGWEAKTD